MLDGQRLPGQHDVYPLRQMEGLLGRRRILRGKLLDPGSRSVHHGPGPNGEALPGERTGHFRAIHPTALRGPEQLLSLHIIGEGGPAFRGGS